MARRLSGASDPRRARGQAVKRALLLAAEYTLRAIIARLDAITVCRHGRGLRLDQEDD